VDEAEGQHHVDNGAPPVAEAVVAGGSENTPRRPPVASSPTAGSAFADRRADLIVAEAVPSPSSIDQHDLLLGSTTLYLAKEPTEVSILLHASRLSARSVVGSRG
jgi:hypothetical protein